MDDVSAIGLTTCHEPETIPGSAGWQQAWYTHSFNK